MCNYVSCFYTGDGDGMERGIDNYNLKEDQVICIQDSFLSLDMTFQKIKQKS